MQKVFLFFLIAMFAACNSSDNAKRSDGAAKNSSNLPTDSTSREATFNFIDACVENSKLTLGDQKAFVFCKCIYTQLQAQNPDMDSARLNAMLTDTARVSKMAANCR